MPRDATLGRLSTKKSCVKRRIGASLTLRERECALRFSAPW